MNIHHIVVRYSTTIRPHSSSECGPHRTVEMLQKALSQQRELTVYHAQEMEKEGQRRLELQKQEYETTIQRHQCFIDQVIGHIVCGKEAQCACTYTCM